jgi:hypothetical protein
MNQNLFPKLIYLDEYTKHSEPTIRIVRPRDRNVPHVKLAEDALSYIQNVKPIPGKTIILVLAMTAGETWGPNRNGDSWPERPLRAGNTVITADEVLPKHYKTFETNAQVYRHHINKDPAGSIGQILRAFYNWTMHRVELLLALDDQKAEDVVQEIHVGKYPACSMGCKIKYDVCAICGNKAPSRAQYCDDAKFQLGQYLPNGKQVFVWNPSPTFYDLSMVRRPADRIGFMMKKVAQVPEIWSSAELGEHMALLSGKLANARKLSDINKIINGDVVAAKEDDGDLNMTRQFARSIAAPAAATMPALDDSVIHEMLRSNPARVLATLASMGIFLTTPEFIKFFVWKMAPGFAIPEGCLEGAVEAQQAVFDVLSKNPDLVEEIQQTGFLNLDPGNIDPALQQRFSTLLEKRSCLRTFVQRRLVDSVLYKTAHMPSPHGYIVVDQKIGQGYATRMAPKLATQNRRWVKDARMQDVIGSGALLSGAYKFFTPGFDTKTAALRLTHERLFVTTPRYQRITLEPKLASASFGEVASWLGKVICL